MGWGSGSRALHLPQPGAVVAVRGLCTRELLDGVIAEAVCVHIIEPIIIVLMNVLCHQSYTLTL